VIGFEPTTFTIGNVIGRRAQLSKNQALRAIAVDARSKYAARKAVRIKRISAYSVGEWPRDPDCVRAV
jgi:hypothetical protein